jgi:hypothetical protein
MLRRNALPPFSGFKYKPIKQPAWKKQHEKSAFDYSFLLVDWDVRSWTWRGVVVVVVVGGGEGSGSAFERKGGKLLVVYKELHPKRYNYSEYFSLIYFSLSFPI